MVISGIGSPGRRRQDDQHSMGKTNLLELHNSTAEDMPGQLGLLSPPPPCPTLRVCNRLRP